MRADQLLHEAYEYARTESERKSECGKYQEGMKRCMTAIQVHNRIVRASQPVSDDLVKLLTRDLRRRVGADFAEAAEAVEKKMRESYEYWKDRPETFTSDRSRARRPMYLRKEEK